MIKQPGSETKRISSGKAWSFAPAFHISVAEASESSVNDILSLVCEVNEAMAQKLDRMAANGIGKVEQFLLET
jgi:hypothetical protein